MRKVTLGEVAREHKEVCRENRSSYPIVGLEHLTPEDVNLTAWSEDAENTFTKMFRKGNVLFGRRRAYLKKAAQAPFDGICSGDITVIEAIPGKIEPELLPFVIQNDQLFDFAVEKSAGSLSPRVKWEHLKNYTFNLPELAEQKKLADLLWAMDAAKQAYQRLLQKTDELVKSQFIEMFGDPQNYGSENTISLGEISEMVSGGTPSSKHPEYFDGDMPFVSTPFLGANYITEKDVTNRISEEGIRNSSTHKIPAYSLLFGNRVGVGKSSINTCEVCTNQDVLSFTNIDPKQYDLLFIKKILDQRQEFFDSQKRGATIKGIPSDLVKKTKIPLIPLETQRTFVGIVQQSDKSKFELERAISELDATYKRIISENLG